MMTFHPHNEGGASAPSNVLPFTGEWQGRAEGLSSYGCSKAGRTLARAQHDARLIISAKSNNDDWTAKLWLAFLQTLPPKQLELIEFRLLGHDLLDNKSAAEALAIVQLATGGKCHRERVRSALDQLQGRA